MRALTATLLLLTLAIPASAQLNVPSQGFDGALVISTTTTIDLSVAVTGDWDTQPTDPDWTPGDGIYDPAQWAVVFHYSTVSIALGATLSFKNHPTGAPVVWLVEGDVDIDGTLALDGKPGATSVINPEGGPGGFRGGNGYAVGLVRGGGFGPGGALAVTGHDGSYATAGFGGAPTYGNDRILPLIGGSGGAGNATSGGGGGGAILMASGGNVVVDGNVFCRGGGNVGSDLGAGRGSGGAIRIVALQIGGTGSLLASGGEAAAGVGRIRLEYVDTPPTVGSVVPGASIAALLPGSDAEIWPSSSDPTLRIVSMNGVAVPADPQGTLSFPWQDVALNGSSGTVDVVLEAGNVPVNSIVQVYLTRVGGDRSAPQSASFVSGNTVLSTWELTLTNLSNGIAAVQAKAILP